MHTLLQIKISQELAQRLENILDELRAKFINLKTEKEVNTNNAALTATCLADAEVITELYRQDQTEMKALGLRLTMQNIIRVFIQAGLEKYECEITDLLAAIGENGVTRGRPKSSTEKVA